MIENWASLRMIKNSQGFWLDLWQYILTSLSSHEYSILLFYIIVHVSRNDSVLTYSVRQRPWLIVKSWNQSPVRTKRFNYIIGSACFFITKKLFFSTFQTRFKRVFFLSLWDGRFFVPTPTHAMTHSIAKLNSDTPILENHFIKCSSWFDLSL